MPNASLPTPVPFVCLAIGDAQMDLYVSRFYEMLRRHVKVPFTLLCFTDRPRQLPAAVETAACSDWDEFKGQGTHPTYNKLRFFDNKTVPYEEFMYLDLSLVIHRDMTDLLEYAFSRPEPLVLVQDWWYPAYNTCVMRIRRSPLSGVYDDFVSGKQYPYRIPVDQDYLTSYVAAHGMQDQVAYFRPHDIVSYKKARGVNRTDAAAAKALVDGATIVKFHGKPKQHQLLDPKYRFWRIWLRNRRDASFWRRELQQNWESLA